jgi:hypothetical protein
MLSENLTRIRQTYQEQIDQDRKADVIKSAIEKLTQTPIQLISWAQYNALIHFINGQADGDQADILLQDTLQALKEGGNELVEEQLILPNGRMPNASILVGFVDRATGEPHIILIQNGWNELSTPAGKVDKQDAILGAGNLLDVGATYFNAAVREFCEETMNERGQQQFMALIQAKEYEYAECDRDGLSIPERDQLFDTRLLTLNLGEQDLTDIQTWFKDPEPDSDDAKQAFARSVSELEYAKLESEQSGPFTNHFGMLDNQRLKFRPTTLIVLHGTETHPELAFKNAIKPLTTASAAASAVSSTVFAAPSSQQPAPTKTGVVDVPVANP